MSDAPEVWNVLTMRGGEVSLLKNLTEDECRAVVQRLRGGDPWSQEAIYRNVLAQLDAPRQQANATMGMATIRTLSAFHVSEPAPGWGVERCEWWGSKGGKLEIWPKPDDYEARLAEAARVAGLVKATNSAVEQAKAA